MADGGTFANLDISESIIKCREDGFEDKNIILDVIMCFEKVQKIEEWDIREIKYKNAWDIFERRNELKGFYTNFEDLIRVVRGFPKVHFRHLISPLNDLGGGFLPIFDGIKNGRMLVDRGKIDAEAHLRYYNSK